jgi:hypothetical protein
MQLGYQRQSLEYEAVLTDLYLLNAIPKGVVEGLTGRAINPNLTLPPAALAALKGDEAAPETESLDDDESVQVDE